MFVCPNCGGNLKFNISTQELSCEHCQSGFDPYAFENKEDDAIETQDFDVTIFTCPQCGGEILSTDTSAAEFCTFCGASTILYSRLHKEKCPHYIIPFQKTKEDCKNAYSQMMKKAVFVPDELKDARHIDGFRGIYIPYWIFHMTQEGPFTLKGSKSKRRGDYIYTDHYALHGEIDAYYKGLSYDASSSFDDNISQKIAPYDVKSMKEFTPAFLSGFYADTADVDSSLYQNDAESIAYNNSIGSVYKKFSGISIHTPGSNNILNTKTESVERAMFPVWFMSYRNGDRVAYTTINGQTGKIVTDLPIDTKKYFKWSMLLALPLFILLNLFFTISPNILLIVCGVLAAISMIFLRYEISQIKKKDAGITDRGRQNTRAPLKEKFKKSGTFTSLLAIALAAIIVLINPVNDILYYGSTIAVLVAIFVTIKELIFYYNIMATRRLPQFDRTGGDDRA